MMRSLSRRGLGRAVLLFCAVGLVASPALAGSYLTRAAILVQGARREGDAMRSNFGDKELVRTLHVLAKARIEAASGMMVPKEVVQAHPHLLLVLEHYERAAEAAEKGEPERFMVLLQRALDEERTFRAVLKQFGWELPSDKNDRRRSD